MFRQYYPEGGWGHLVVVVALATTALTQGLLIGPQAALARGLIRLYRPSQLQSSLLWVRLINIIFFYFKHHRRGL
jgi:hypothetical protein